MTSFLFRSSVKRLLLVCMAALPLHSNATPGSVKGQVEFVRTHDAAQFPEWAPPKFWFSLKGVTQAGGCTKWYNSILFVMNDKPSLSMVLAAQASGQEIAVIYDDSRMSNGLCAASYITIGNPAPLY